MSSTQRLVNEWNGRKTTGTVITRPSESSFGTVLHQSLTEPVRRPLWSWVSVSTPVGRVNRTYRLSRVRVGSMEPIFVPRSKLGRKLVALRKQALGSGMTLWDAERILATIRRNRGESAHEEEDIH